MQARVIIREGSLDPVVSRLLGPGNRTFLEVASMVATWWIVEFFVQWVRAEKLLKSEYKHLLGVLVWGRFDWPPLQYMKTQYNSIIIVFPKTIFFPTF